MLAIIIINFNKYEKTFECIDSIKKSNFKLYKIYLLDNASTNDSYEKLYEKYSEDNDIILIKSEENLGYARGNNLCIEYAKKDGFNYAVISNNDILYDENTLLELYNEIQKKEFFIIAPKVILPNGNIQKSNKINRPSFLYYICHETYINRFFKEKNYALSEKREVYWVAGCCFIINLNMFEKIKYFDKNTFLFYEEYIISEKARKMNYKILFNPNIKVVHHHGASMGDVNVNIYLEHLKSELYFWKEYRNISNIKLWIIYIIRNLEIAVSLYKRKRIKEYKNFKYKSREILKQIKDKIF